MFSVLNKINYSLVRVVRNYYCYSRWSLLPPPAAAAAAAATSLAVAAAPAPAQHCYAPATVS